jgi:hypothetical protein
MMGDLIASLHGYAAISSALLRQLRVSKYDGLEKATQSVVIDVSLERCGVWSAGCLSTLLFGDPPKALLWDVAVDEIPFSWPLPTLTAIVSSDGVSIQLLGLDLPKHLKPTLDSLDAPKSFWAKLAWVFLTKVLTNTTAPTRILKLVPILQAVNAFVLASARSKTYKELKKTFDKHGVWYTIVRSPGQALTYEQAVVTDSFRYQQFVNSPVHFE